jgi:phage terminase large subunit
MDFGYSNDPTTLIGLYKYNDAYIFDEIIYQKKLLNSDISKLLNENNIQEVIYADSAEPKSIAELKTYRHKILPCTKGKDSIVYGINLINQNKIFVTSRSKNLIKELQSYTWMKDREGNTINKPIDAFNHCIDACRYAITSQLKNPNAGKYFIR